MNTPLRCFGVRSAISAGLAGMARASTVAISELMVMSIGMLSAYRNASVSMA